MLFYYKILIISLVGHNAMITTSLNRSIGVASHMYNDATLAIMNINDTGLMLLL